MEASSAEQSTELKLTPAGSHGFSTGSPLREGENRQNASGSESGNGVFPYARGDVGPPPANANLAMRLEPQNAEISLEI